MILIRNRDWGGLDMTFVYHPYWDGSIHKYVDDPDWEVTVKPVAERTMPGATKERM